MALITPRGVGIGGGAGIKRYITTRVSYGNDGIEPGKRAQSCKRGLCLARTWSNKEGASGRTCVNGANQLRGVGDVAAP